MKKFILNLLAAALLLTVSNAETKAQISVGVSVGIWTPPPEYASVNYYYLPDIESYYYVPTHQYVYLSGGRWIFRRSLPPRYRYYDIRTGYKVAVNRPRPYRYFSHDRAAYSHFRGRRDGVIVRDHYRTRVINRNHYTSHARPARPHTVYKPVPHHTAHAVRPHAVSHSRPAPAHHDASHHGGGRPHGGGHGHH
ncbi:MAG TPA: hypothetical protein VHA56_16385 [Mucilaginibacter sp.]|nr:hypothetical protein [Mucilaginibacter sp.]